MQSLFNRDSLTFFKKMVSSFIVLTFLTSLVVSPAGAQILPVLNNPGRLVSGYQPPILLGLKIHPENPLLFDFIVDQGQTKLSTDELKSETTKLVKYFLAALTIPDKEVWVNLSPTEKDRIIPDVLGQTTMGKTMLEQDYVLKQLAASLTNPETELGKKYWDNVNVNEGSIAVGAYCNTPLQNKVWIMPAKAEVLESNGIVLVGEKRLKVMLDEEYQAVGAYCNTPLQKNVISSQIFRTTILPTIEKAVNEGKDFADVRQIYNSVILAAWYKKALKESLLGKVYADKGKVAGVETDDKQMKQRIYEQYLAAFKKGAYNLIKEEADENGDLIPRKYFSGGITSLGLNTAGTPIIEERQISTEQAENMLTAATPLVVQVYAATAVSEGETVSAAAQAKAVDGGERRKLDISSSPIEAISKLAASVVFSLAIFFPTVYPIEAASQSKEMSQIYYQDQANRDKSVPRVQNISTAQQELKKNLDQMIRNLKERHNGDLVPDIVDGAQLKKILSNNFQTFDEVAVKVKQAFAAAKDPNAKASLQKEVLRWVYLYIHENTEYDKNSISVKEPNSADLRNAIVGKSKIVYAPKRTLICQSAVILVAMILNDFGFSTELNDVSALEIKNNFKGKDMSGIGGHVAILVKLANGDIWIFDLTQGWSNQLNVNVPHQSVKTIEGNVVIVEPGNVNLRNLTGWTIRDISKQQKDALVMSAGIKLLVDLQSEFNHSIDQNRKNDDLDRLGKDFTNIIARIDAFLVSRDRDVIAAMRTDDVFIRGQYFFDEGQVGPKGLIDAFIKLKSIAQSNLDKLKKVNYQASVSPTVLISPADINYINSLGIKMNEIAMLISASNGETIKSLKDIQNELSGPKIADIEKRAKALQVRGDQVVQMINSMRTIVQKNIIVATEKVAIDQLKVLTNNFNQWANDKDWNNAKPKLEAIRSDLDSISRNNPLASDQLKAHIEKFKAEIQRVINLRTSRGAQNDFLIPALALENLEPQLLAGQVVDWQGESSVASSGVNKFSIDLNPRVITGPENIISAINDGRIKAGTKILGYEYYEGADKHTLVLSPKGKETVVENIEDIPFKGRVLKLEGLRPIAIEDFASVTLAASSGISITLPKIQELIGARFKEGVLNGSIDVGTKIDSFTYWVSENEQGRSTKTKIEAVDTEKAVIKFEGYALMSLDKIISVTLAASSALDQERADLVGKTLTDQKAIIDAVAVLKAGDGITVTYKHFDGRKEDTESIKGSIIKINGQSIGRKEMTIDGSTIVYVKVSRPGEEDAYDIKGFTVQNILSITIDSLAASSTVDVQDVEVDKRMFWVNKFWMALHSRKRNINGMYDLGKDNLVKIAKIGDLRWVGIYDQTENRWFELVVDSNDKPLAYGASMIPVQAYTDSIFLTFNVFSDVQRNRLALGKNKINSWDILQGRMDILRTITGRKSFIVQGKQIFGREAIERTAVIFYLKHGFDFLDPVSPNVEEIKRRVLKNERVEDYELRALAFSGKMTYTLPSQSEAGTIQPQPVQQQQAQDNRKPTDVGGIDFDPTNMNLQIKRDGKGVPLPLPEQNLEQINIQGLFPVIINITPINSQTLPIFLGQAPKEPAREPELAARTVS